MLVDADQLPLLRDASLLQVTQLVGTLPFPFGVIHLLQAFQVLVLFLLQPQRLPGILSAPGIGWGKGLMGGAKGGCHRGGRIEGRG